jgi:uncharacterized membrane protein YeaQ/YmgE (transglycosylase-associated protein family)
LEVCRLVCAVSLYKFPTVRLQAGSGAIYDLSRFKETKMPGFMVVILIGVIIGFIARFLYPGRNTPHGFILTTVLGIAGATLATYVGRWIGWIEPNQLADPISMIVGAIIVLFSWNHLALYGIVRDPGRAADQNTPPPPEA